jgi:hypothetical protein
MANICNNTITFSGEDLSLIRNLFDEIKKENTDGYGWLPEGYKGEYGHYLFDVDITDHDDEIIVDCWTKWAPPIEEMIYLCKNTNIHVNINYDEMGMGLYGQCYYDSKTNEFKDVCLDDDDINRIQYDEDNDIYTLDGNPVESDYEEYYNMLTEKLNKQLTT